jgi:hypothetical protein
VEEGFAGDDFEAGEAGAAGAAGCAEAEPGEEGAVLVGVAGEEAAAAVGGVEEGFAEEEAFFGVGEVDAGEDGGVVGGDVVAEQGEFEAVLAGGGAVAAGAVAAFDGEEGDDIGREAGFELVGGLVTDFDADGGVAAVELGEAGGEADDAVFGEADEVGVGGGDGAAGGDEALFGAGSGEDDIAGFEGGPGGGKREEPKPAHLPMLSLLGGGVGGGEGGVAYRLGSV